MKKLTTQNVKYPSPLVIRNHNARSTNMHLPSPPKNQHSEDEEEFQSIPILAIVTAYIQSIVKIDLLSV